MLNKMTSGFHGKILVVDLSNLSLQDESIPDEVYRQYYGGYGLGIHYIYKNIVPNSDPLGPGNIIGFCPGLLTGTPVQFSGRFMVCGKSPLTGKGIRSNGEKSNGGWGNANSGGTFGPEIKKTGYDAIFFKGISEKPVYLYINGEEKKLVDASELWGKDIIETEKILKKKHGKDFKISTIGPAGEKLSLISGIVNDSGRIAARSGLGAVMGSKKLKALCIRGNKRVKYHNKTELMKYVKEYAVQFKKNAKKGILTKMMTSFDKMAPLMRVMGLGNDALDGPFLGKIATQMFSSSALGTSALNVISSQNGDSPVKNFKGTGYIDFPYKKAMEIRGKNLRSLMKKQYGCFACPVRCGAILEYEGLPYEEKETHRPEYETCSAFGALILNNDLDLLLKVNEFLNRAGMDSISAGNTVAYVIECCEKGLLKKEDFKCTDFPEGFLPNWEDHSYLLTLLQLMVNREGIGDILADGTKIASEKIKNSESFAINANGQEIPMHDPRLDPMLGVTYITDPTPGRHTAASLNFEMMGGKYFIEGIGKMKTKKQSEFGPLQAKTAKFHQTIEATGLCFFSENMGRFPYLQVINAFTGWNIDLDELLETGHRIQTLRQMFNAREGAIRHEIPQRAIGSPPQQKGPIKKTSIDLEIIAQDYYKSIGFNKNGIPKKETLKKLDLDFALSDLEEATGTPKPLINEYLQG
ncbi:MAG: aldehyde ferredoxin oxidoreductase family protein [Promethearchaeota archaeon]